MMAPGLILVEILSQAKIGIGVCNADLVSGSRDLSTALSANQELTVQP